ncbi:MAG: HlyC/CorC family transporter [Clostridiales bacterium]|nr:HlyC/CorC family transporter [Clostridiales bacterium]
MGDTNIFSQLLLQLILIALNAVFACAEIAVLSFNGAKLEKMAEDGDRRARRLLKLTDEPARFLATIQVAITLSGFLASAFAADNFATLLSDWVVSLGVKIPAHTVHSVAVVVITLILSYFTLVLGELVPKRLAMKKAEQLSLALSGLISFIARVFSPIVSLLTASTNALLRLFGIDPAEEDDEGSEEEIRMMVDSSSEKGLIDTEEGEMIQNVFEFDDLTVGEIATHRTEVTFLWKDETDEEWADTIRSDAHSFYPICDESIDNVVGILNSKIYFRLDDLSRENVMKEAVRTVFFVPESMKADTLFRNMKQQRNNFAVVLDEYGGTHGIVTMSDLLVQIVGEFDDEEEIEQDIFPAGENAWRINCRAELEELEDLFDLEEIEAESTTVSGFVIEQFGDIPQSGDTFTYEDIFTVEVLSSDPKRVIEILVTAIRHEEEDEDD